MAKRKRKLNKDLLPTIDGVLIRCVMDYLAACDDVDRLRSCVEAAIHGYYE